MKFGSPEVVEQVIDGRHYIRGKLLTVRNMLVTQPKKTTPTINFNKPETPLMATAEEVEAKGRAQKLKLEAVGGTVSRSHVVVESSLSFTLIWPSILLACSHMYMRLCMRSWPTFQK